MFSPILCPLLVIFNPPNCLLTVKKITELYHLFIVELKATKSNLKDKKKEKFTLVLFCDNLL